MQPSNIARFAALAIDRGGVFSTLPHYPLERQMVQGLCVHFLY